MAKNPSAPKVPTADENAPEELPERSFRIIPSDDEENAVSRVSVGADPRISIGAGEKFATTDPRLADRLAAQPELEEVKR